MAYAFNEDRSKIDVVPSSGGTFSGDVLLKNSNIDRDGEDPSERVYGNTDLKLVDKDGELIGLVRADKLDDGSTALVIRAYNEYLGTQEYNEFAIIRKNSSDTRSEYSVSNPATFRDAINAVGCYDQKAMKSRITPLSGPYNVWGVAATCINEDNVDMFEKDFILVSTNAGLVFWNNTDNTSHWAVNFKPTKTFTASDVITPESGITIESIQCATCSNMIQLVIEFKSSTSRSGTQFTIGTLKDGFKPAVDAYGAFGQISIKPAIAWAKSSSGEVKMLATTLNANTSCVVAFTYIKNA